MHRKEQWDHNHTATTKILMFISNRELWLFLHLCMIICGCAWVFVWVCTHESKKCRCVSMCGGQKSLLGIFLYDFAQILKDTVCQWFQANLVLYYFPDSDFSHPIYNKHLVGAKSSRLPACLMSQQTPFQNPNSPHQRQHAQCHARSLFLHAAKRCTLTLLFSRAVCWEEGLPSKGCSLQLSFLQASGSFCSFELTEASTTHWRFVKEPASM